MILFNLSGHGHFDLAAYDAYLSGTLEDPEFDRSGVDAALARLPRDMPALSSPAPRAAPTARGGP